MARSTMICQSCGKEYHDVAEYYEHVNSHEEEKKMKQD